MKPPLRRLRARRNAERQSFRDLRRLITRGNLVGRWPPRNEVRNAYRALVTIAVLDDTGGSPNVQPRLNITVVRVCDPVFSV